MRSGQLEGNSSWNRKSESSNLIVLPSRSLSSLFESIEIRKSDMHPRTRKALYSLRLRKIFSGVFVKANERIMEILQKVEPYVTYGYPKSEEREGSDLQEKFWKH